MSAKKCKLIVQVLYASMPQAGFAALYSQMMTSNPHCCKHNHRNVLHNMGMLRNPFGTIIGNQMCIINPSIGKMMHIGWQIELGEPPMK
jgi:hypothetical protein